MLYVKSSMEEGVGVEMYGMGWMERVEGVRRLNTIELRRFVHRWRHGIWWHGNAVVTLTTDHRTVAVPLLLVDWYSFLAASVAAACSQWLPLECSRCCCRANSDNGLRVGDAPRLRPNMCLHLAPGCIFAGG